MEAELLRDMIADREQRIANILRKTDEHSVKQQRMVHDFDNVHADFVDQQVQYKTERSHLLHRRQEALRLLADAEHELQMQGVSLQKYAGAVRQDQQQMTDSSYVMKMQAQLCKAMHSMGIVDHQMELAKEHCDALIKFQKDQITRLLEEKSHIELKLMNDLMMMDDDRRGMEKEKQAELDEIRREIEAVEEQLEENNDDENSHTENTEDEELARDLANNEDEKAAKEELMNQLQEKRQEIDRLERVTEEQEETIEELHDMGGTADMIRDEFDSDDDDAMALPKKPTKRQQEAASAAMAVAETAGAAATSAATAPPKEFSAEDHMAAVKARLEASGEAVDEVEDIDVNDILARSRQRAEGRTLGSEHDEDDLGEDASADYSENHEFSENWDDSAREQSFSVRSEDLLDDPSEAPTTEHSDRRDETHTGDEDKDTTEQSEHSPIGGMENQPNEGMSERSAALASGNRDDEGPHENDLEDEGSDRAETADDGGKEDTQVNLANQKNQSDRNGDENDSDDEKKGTVIDASPEMNGNGVTAEVEGADEQ